VKFTGPTRQKRPWRPLDRMPRRTVRDYENILARLHGLPAYVDQNIDLLNESIARGLTQPRVVVSARMAAMVG
jgi:uncharacterized protein (DUF885 family)